MEFQRHSQPFECLGVQLSRPVDSLGEKKYAILRNVRAYADGTIHPRRGLSQPSAFMESPVHSIKRFYDSFTNTEDEITGGGTKLYMGGVQVDTGYSGNPLSFVPHRPSSTPEAYVYIADSLKLRKVNKDREVFNVGIAPPNVPLSAALSAPAYTTIEDFESLPNGWVSGGTAGALSSPSRVSTTIAYILYDSGSAGWASISPVALSSTIQAGCLLLVGGSEAMRVEGVYPAASDTTISSISYDSGGTGLCTIQLSTPTYGLQRDSLLRLAATENVRVLDVMPGRDGLPAFRCSTVSTFMAGATVEGLESFRANLVGTFAAGATLTSEAFETTISTGIGHVTKVANFDLSFVDNRPIKAEDEIHVSIKLDVNDRLVEGKVMFALDASADFTGNYFFFPFRANDLTPAVSDTLTTLTTQQTAVQTTLIEGSYSSGLYDRLLRSHEGDALYFDGQFDGTLSGGDFTDPTIFEPLDPGTTTTTTTTGSNQWTELRFKVGDLTRVGPDASKTLAHVTGVRIQLNVSDAIVADFDSFWIGGTYGLTSVIFPYVWTYRYKASTTGAVSNPAPPMRSGLLVQRGAVTLTSIASTDPQVDTIEYFRRGGTLIEWHFVGTSPNGGTFLDSYRDEVVSGNFGLDFDNFQPFPIADAPRSGVCNVVGTEVERVSGDVFNVLWARGSEIIIDGVPNSLYASPTSADRLSLEEAQGTLTGVTFSLRSPTLQAQPMASMWGPYSVGGLVYMFACKDGTLYFTKANNPDSAPEENQIEVTSPQEPLVGGCIHDGQAYVFSTERMFRVLPTFTQGAQFEVQELPIGKGLVAPWALCVDETINFVSRDGIYTTNGQEVRSLTDADLYPLFPHDGQAGSQTNGYAPPDYESPQYLRLAAGDGLIKFTSRDTSLVPQTWVYDSRHKAWMSHDIYHPFVVCHYWDEGGLDGHSIPTRERVGASDGRVYTANRAADDNGFPIFSQVRTPSLTLGEMRAEKLFGDYSVDHVGVVSTLTPMFNNATTSLLPTTIVQVGTRGTSIADLASGGGVQARDLALDLAFTDPNVVLFEWQPSFVPRPEDTKLRWTDFHNDGEPGAKFLQGLVLTANTKGVARTIQVQGDGGVVIATLNVNHNGYLTKAYPGAGDTWTPTITHMMRLVPTDLVDQWELFDVKWVWDPAPEEAIKWQTQGTSHDFMDFHHLRRIWLALQSNAQVTLNLNVDGVDYTYIIDSTAGQYRKVDVPLQAIKGKIWTYTFTSSLPFRMFVRDTAVEIHGWAEGGPYKISQPFGDLHRTLISTGESMGARI
jgi:hypothetical protein